jgi:hypothetical protein
LAVARLLEDQGVFAAGSSFDAIKAVVYRALSTKPDDQVLSPDTLTRFIDGFQMGEQEAARLRATLAGVDLDTARPETGTGPAAPVNLPADAAVRHHVTISLHEFHTVGGDGLPQHHRTVQVIRSLVDGFRSYPYRYDTDAADVRVVRGGRIGAPLIADGSLHGLEIELARPLRQFETASIEYETTFHYRQAPPREFRRAARGQTDNVELYLRFHRMRLPDKIWWASWGWQGDQPGSQILHRNAYAWSPTWPSTGTCRSCGARSPASTGHGDQPDDDNATPPGVSAAR